MWGGVLNFNIITAIKEVVNSLDDPNTAGLILEEQAKSLKNILADPAIQHLIKVRLPLFFLGVRCVTNEYIQLVILYFL